MAASAAALAAPCPETLTRAESNRLNSLHSTGPRTGAGKLISSQNATKHGLFTCITALPPHEREILDGFLAEFSPGPDASAALLELCTRWAIVRYRIDKCQRLQFACHHELLCQRLEKEETPFPEDPLELARLEARAFIDDADGPKVLFRLYNYEARLNRELDRIHKEYRELRAAEAQVVEAELAETGFADAALASFFQTPGDAPQTPRSAPCPCGSGRKFKRCCGQNAPAVLHQER